MEKRSFVIILNPTAENGNAYKKLPIIDKFFSSNKTEYKIILTERIGHAIEIASSLKDNPELVVIAAGGDGTSNEVINGLMPCYSSTASSPAQQKCAKLGVLPIGRGNDFAYGAGVPSDFREGMQLLLEGESFPIDVGQIIGGDYPQGRYFGNGIGIGFDAIVGLEAAKMKYLHGMTSYIAAALKKLIVLPKVPTVEIGYNNEKQTIRPALISIMNGKRMGGAFFMAPDGNINDGLFNLSITQHGSRLSLLKAMALYMEGQQSKHSDTFMASADKVLLKAISRGMTAHADGETICINGTELEIRIIPSALQIITNRK